MGNSDPSIGDYAVIGDCRCAALVSRDGSIDWFALPRFDSPTFFAALLDARRGGRFRIQPASSFEASRRYVGFTNVLETTFRTDTGELRLTDLMPVADEAAMHGELLPEHEILRRVECVRGEVDIEILYDPRPEYARHTARIHLSPIGWLCQHGRHAIVLMSDVPLEPLEQMELMETVERAGPREPLESVERLEPRESSHSVESRESLRPWRRRKHAARTARVLGAHVRLRAGDVRFLSLSTSEQEPAIAPPLGEYAEHRLDRSLRWWEDWAGRCTYDGPYREAVVRSALTLKLMTFAPSGAVVAAPTTSLPEKVGGGRNWDYRFCWLRDASMTLRALFGLGYHEEGEAFMYWMLHATRLTQPELQILYDVYGETRLPERELPYLSGYRDSRPVRIGNGAADQLQLDIYGAVADAAYRYVLEGGRLNREMRRVLVGFGETVCRRWHEPDEGIWELRSGRQHHTLSRAMCWVALDRLLALHARGELEAPAERFAWTADAIRDEVERRGFHPGLNSYVATLDGDDIDASLLLLPLYGYIDADHPRMRGTGAAIRERLGSGSLIYRYRYGDGLTGHEGAFGVCSFWSVECLAGQGERDLAMQDFDRLLSYANDVGLFAEQIDVESGEPLGNFPQAYTHIGLIGAALTLAGPGTGPRHDP